jgi:hypothetical protein
MLALGIAVFIIAIISPEFADFWNRYPGAFLRAVLALITNIIPLSLAEIALILLPIAAAVIIILILRGKLDKIKSPLKFTVSILSVASLFISLFTLGFGVGYHTTSLDQKLELKKEAVSKEELAAAASYLADMANREAKNVEFEHQSFSKMPYSFGDLCTKLNAAYDILCNEYNFIQRLYSRAKPVMLSEPMSYTHITGIYTYFTGEANVNVNFPDYTLPFTTAHEMAHQRGVAREDEANFIAFLVCMNSESDYIRYCAYLNMYEYVASALYRADRSLYSDVVSHINMNTRYEMVAYNDFFEQYEDSTAGKVSNAVNNTHLIINGTEGTKSYGLVVDLAVAYYKDK